MTVFKHIKDKVGNLYDVPVQDVQVNGASIVSEGVANVPFATSKKAGVVLYSSSYGTYVSNTGLITVSPARDTEIANRASGVITSDYKPIVPTTLDYGVKLALCDGKGAAYTATEQTAAKARLGVTDYELPTASSSTLGGVKVGEGLGISSGTLYTQTEAFAGFAASSALSITSTATNIPLVASIAQGEGVNVVDGQLEATKSGTMVINYSFSVTGSSTAAGVYLRWAKGSSWLGRSFTKSGTTAISGGGMLAFTVADGAIVYPQMFTQSSSYTATIDAGGINTDHSVSFFTLSAKVI